MATCWTDGRTGPRQPGVHSFRTRAHTHTQTYTHTDTSAANFARSPPRTTTPPPRRARTNTRGDVNERWHTALSPRSLWLSYHCHRHCTVQNTTWGYFPSLIQQQPPPLPLSPYSRRGGGHVVVRPPSAVGDDGHANKIIIINVTITIYCTVQWV